MEQFIPPATITLLLAASKIAHFESLSWMYSQTAELEGPRESVRQLVHLRRLVVFVFMQGLVIAYLWQYGWQSTLGLLLISNTVRNSWIYTVKRAVKGDHLARGTLGTTAFWVLIIPLAYQVSWFGLLEPTPVAQAF